MGIFKTFLQGLGFQNDGVRETVEAMAKTEANVPLEKYVPNQSNGNKQLSLNNLVMYAPRNNAEVKLLIECVKNNEACIVNLGELNKGEVKSILDYLSGGMFALGGQISRLQGDLYVLSPKNVTITTL